MKADLMDLKLVRFEVFKPHPVSDLIFYVQMNFEAGSGSKNKL
jgi:hypothetical protein